MRRLSSITLSLATCLLVALAMVGCDSSPSSVQDIDIQPQLSTPGNVGLVLAEGSASFDIQYQGLDQHPEATSTGALAVSKANESGTPSEGEQQWEVTYPESVDGVVTENVILQTSSGGSQITDTVSVTISRFVILSNFQNTTAIVTDYESRSDTTSGGTSISMDSTNVSDNTSGVASLRIESTPSGTATIERRTSAPGAERFAFKVLPDPSTSFTLTLTFTDSTDGGTSTYSVDVPIEAGSQWLQYEIALSQIGDGFNPVATRAGGDGPLLDIEMSTDQDVAFNVDELRFVNQDEVVAGVHDFEQETLEYSCITLGTSGDVAESSDGFTARVLDGSGCFGYNYNNLRVTGSSDGVLSFWVNADQGDEIFVFLETPNGEGGFNFGNGSTFTLPTGGWQQVEIPFSEFGDNPAVIQSVGLSNVGFEAAQGSSNSFLIDDIRLLGGN